MLTFLAPAFLAGIAAAAVPIVLHMLKREPEPRIKFAAVSLLKHAPVEQSERRRLRELLLLALRVATLVLLAVAFARPFFASGAVAAANAITVVALDTSYSISAPGRFERARQLAKEAVNRVGAGDLVAVVTFADQAQIVAKPSVDRVLATSAIDRTALSFGATRYRAALSAAGQALDGHPGSIVLVTDLQENGWDAGDRASVSDNTTISVVDVGALPANLAITSVRAAADRIAATIRNAGDEAREARVRLAIDGKAAGETAALVGAHQSTDVSFAAAGRGTQAVVTVDDASGLQADNTRYAVLGAGLVPTVLVVTGSGDLSRDGFYVQQALAAGGGEGTAFQPASISGAQLSTLSAERLAPHAAVMLLSTRGLERRGREAIAAYVQAGGGLIVAAGPEIDGDVVGDVLGDGTNLRIATDPGATADVRALAPADIRHPVFRAFDGTAATLGLVAFRTAARVGGKGCQTLARFTTGDPALIECPAGSGRALVVASDLDNRWNDFPLHATFVPFLHETVRYVANTRAHGAEYVVGAATGLPATPGIAAIDAETAGTPPQRVAVNVDPRESDPARISAEDFQSAVARLKPAAAPAIRAEAKQQEDRQHLWQYAIALLLVTLVFEGVLASRTA